MPTAHKHNNAKNKTAANKRKVERSTAKKARSVPKKHTKKVSVNVKTKKLLKTAKKAKISAKIKSNTRQKENIKHKSKRALLLEQAAIEEHSKTVEVVKNIANNDAFNRFLSQNIGKRASDVIQLLETPKTDDSLAESLSIKINEVRRMLNVLSSYGLVRYDSHKDNQGWLTFSWHINTEKMKEFGDSLKTTSSSEENYNLPENCNDFFYCSKCYSVQKLILPFDSAFESDFKCDCGRKLNQLNREQVIQMFKQGPEQ